MAELSATTELPAANVTMALTLLDFLTTSRSSLDQDTGATILDALNSLSRRLTPSQVTMAVQVVSRLANQTTGLTEEMGNILLQIADRVLTGQYYSSQTASQRTCR
jgi:hypothetical protein